MARRFQWLCLYPGHASADLDTNFGLTVSQVVSSLLILSLVALRSQMDAPLPLIDAGNAYHVRPGVIFSCFDCMVCTFAFVLIGSLSTWPKLFCPVLHFVLLRLLAPTHARLR